MSEWKPCKRREFISKLRKLGFVGPKQGGRHQFMKFGSYKQTIPSQKEYSVPLLKKLIKQVEQGLGRVNNPISPEEWDKL